MYVYVKFSKRIQRCVAFEIEHRTCPAAVHLMLVAAVQVKAYWDGRRSGLQVIALHNDDERFFFETHLKILEQFFSDETT